MTVPPARGEVLPRISLRRAILLGRQLHHDPQIAPAAARTLPVSCKHFLRESPSNLAGALRVSCVRMPASNGSENKRERLHWSDGTDTTCETQSGDSLIL